MGNTRKEIKGYKLSIKTADGKTRRRKFDTIDEAFREAMLQENLGNKVALNRIEPGGISRTKQKENEKMQVFTYCTQETFTFIKSKEIYDFDGFLTKYSMYAHAIDGEIDKYLFYYDGFDYIDLEEDEPDWECETLEEAEEWFSNYKGSEEE